MDIKTILARTLLALAAMAAPPALAQTASVQGSACAGGILYTVRSHGESQPVAAGGDAASLQQNRRVEVVSGCPDKVERVALHGRAGVRRRVDPSSAVQHFHAALRPRNEGKKARVSS